MCVSLSQERIGSEYKCRRRGVGVYGWKKEVEEERIKESQQNKEHLSWQKPTGATIQTRLSVSVCVSCLSLLFIMYVGANMFIWLHFGSGHWSSIPWKITGRSLCGHLAPAFQRERNNNCLCDIFHMHSVTLCSFFVWLFCASSGMLEVEPEGRRREREKRVKESEWETGKSESRSWVSAESQQLRKQWIKFGSGRASVSWGERRAAEGERMDGWMWREKKGESEALGRATQSRLQMCRQQQCGCFGPHQAALGVSPAHVPTPPVNHPSQASGNTAATKPLRLDPQNGLASDRQTPMSPLCRIIPVIVSLAAYAR